MPKSKKKNQKKQQNKRSKERKRKARTNFASCCIIVPQSDLILK